MLRSTLMAIDARTCEIDEEYYTLCVLFSVFVSIDTTCSMYRCSATWVVTWLKGKIDLRFSKVPLKGIRLSGRIL